jgi:hypothetical protein
MDHSPEYLVAFGRAGHLGRFRAAEPSYRRGDAVVVRGRRGVELGEVLGPLTGPTLPDEYVGDVLRASLDDDRAAATASARRALAICTEAETVAAELDLPLTVLDVEVMLDGRGAVLHGLAYAPCDAGPLLERLGESHAMVVRYYDLGAEPPSPADAPDAEEKLTCDKPDCGEGKCGDGDGCSSCSAGSAKDLEAYFAQLREKMERRQAVPLA